MPKTEVILTHNIVGLGGESDQVKVAPGYARNYLIPQGLAVPLTGANKRRIESLRQRRAEREAHELNSMTELSKSLSKLIAVLAVKTGDDGKMFGSVTSGAIVDQLKTQFDISLDKRKVHLEKPIKTLGEHEVELRLHADVVCLLKVRVESTTPAAPKAGAEVAPPEAPRRFARPEKTDKAEKAAEKPEKAAKPDKTAKAEKAGKTDKPEKPERKPKTAKP
jgi:large subunit ribosomal protein L9